MNRFNACPDGPVIQGMWESRNPALPQPGDVVPSHYSLLGMGFCFPDGGVFSDAAGTKPITYCDGLAPVYSNAATISVIAYAWPDPLPVVPAPDRPADRMTGARWVIYPS